MRSLTAILAAMIVLVVIGVGVYLSQQNQPQDSVYAILSHCHFEQGACQQLLSDGQVLHFTFSPSELRPMEPLLLSVSGSSLKHLQENQMKVWFEGRDMSMGQHFMLPVSIDRQTSSETTQKERIFKGMIPICSVDERMVWRLVVELPFDSISENLTEVSGRYSRLQIHFDLM